MRDAAAARARGRDEDALFVQEASRKLNAATRAAGIERPQQPEPAQLESGCICQRLEALAPCDG